MTKLQNFYIFKFSSDRLKDCNYKLNITLDEARLNQEVVSMGDSQVLRSLRKLKGIEVDVGYIRKLFTEKKKIKHFRSSSENQKRLLEIEKEIDGLLFVPEIVSIVIRDNRHYEKMIKQGLWINGSRFSRLLVGAGNARRNTVIFVSNSYSTPLKNILNNNRKDIPLVDAKYNAYFALANSATLSVSTPRFCVIPDKEIERMEKVDFVVEDTDEEYIEEREMPIKFNLWDGMGIISPKQSEAWAKELGLDYIPAAWCIRGSFTKGMVCTFDFHRFAYDVAHERMITDAWGNQVHVDDVEVILTTSQFKLWNAYDSCQEYVRSCQENDLGWGISRYTPKQDKTHCYSNYQFLQVLNLDDNQIEKLCEKTLTFFQSVMGGDYRYALLYLLGELCNQKELPENWFEHLDDPVAKALILNPSLLEDRYVRQHLANSLNKKMRESYMGVLLLNGNYQVMISDPYALCEHVFGMDVVGLLKRGEHYSKFWNDRNENRVAALRAPLTWRSELNILNLKNNEETEKWYQYLGSGIIYNVHGNDVMLHADSDFDLDLAMTTNQKEFIECAYGGLPITYTKKSAPKKQTDELNLHLADMNSFNSKIGFLTNLSTTMYTMAALYPEGSVEHNELIHRLKLCRQQQGNQIDKAKGILVRPIPTHWTKWTRITDDMTLEEKEKAEFNNKLLVDKRPYFMRYLYPDYNAKYLKLRENYDNYCISKFGYNFDQLKSKSEHDEYEKNIIKGYNRFVPLLDSDCVMNKICHYMEGKVGDIKTSIRNSKRFDSSILKDADIEIDIVRLDKMYDLYREYSRGRKSHHDTYNQFEGKSQQEFIKYIERKSFDISSDIAELANLAVHVCYDLYPNSSKEFVWRVFGDGLIVNIWKNSGNEQFIPLLDADGDIEFMGKRYGMKEICIN